MSYLEKGCNGTKTRKVKTVGIDMYYFSFSVFSCTLHWLLPLPAHWHVYLTSTSSTALTMILLSSSHCHFAIRHALTAIASGPCSPHLDYSAALASLISAMSSISPCNLKLLLFPSYSHFHPVLMSYSHGLGLHHLQDYCSGKKPGITWNWNS